MADPVSFLHTAPFVVDGWRVDPPLLRARRGSEEATLEPKVMGVLCALAERPGEAVSRGELFDAVWPDVVVGDDVLTRCVSELRKLFGDAARSPRVIATVPRVGYRLLVPVGDARPLASPAERVREPAGTASAPRRRWPTVLAGAAALALVATASYSIGRTADPEPLTAHPFTSEPGFEWNPALSPDGERVAYVQGDPLPATVTVRPVSGGEPLGIATGGGYAVSPRWSPDGASIAYIRAVDGRSCRVLLVPALGGPERTLADCTVDRLETLDWLDDATLVVGGHPEGDAGMARLDVPTGRLTPFGYDAPPGAVDLGPRVAPDGHVLFARRIGEAGYRLMAVDPETNVVTEWTRTPGAIVGVDAWGAGAVYTVAQGSSGRLMRIDAPGAAPRPLAVAGAGVRPDRVGDRLVFERWRVDVGLFDVRPADDPEADATLVPVAASTGYDGLPVVSPDGARLAFLSERSGSLQVWTAERSGARARRLTEMDAVAGSPPRWSPDGQRLAFAAVVDGDAEVFVIDRPDEVLASGLAPPPRRLPAPGSAESEPAWSPDGQWLTVASDRSGTLEAWRVPVGGGAGERLTRGGARGARWGPDGSAVYTMRPGVDGLWRRTAGGEEVAVVPELQPRHLHNWTPTPGGILYLDRQPGVREALRSTVLGLVTTLPRGGVVASLDAGPDGSIVISRVGERDVDLALVDLP